jgi:hypothetical protein
MGDTAPGEQRREHQVEQLHRSNARQAASFGPSSLDRRCELTKSER